MIPQLSKALSSGFTSKQIMDFILKKFPQHKSVIQNALTAGFTTDQFLKYLAGGKKALSMPEQETPEAATEFQQTRNRDISRREDVNKKGIQAAGLVGAGLAAPMAATALQHALPNSLKPMTAPLTTALQQQTQQSQPQQPPIPTVQDVSSVTQPQQTQQSQPAPQPVEEKTTIDGTVITGMVKALAKSEGKDRDDIIAFLKTSKLDDVAHVILLDELDEANDKDSLSNAYTIINSVSMTSKQRQSLTAAFVKKRSSIK